VQPADEEYQCQHLESFLPALLHIDSSADLWISVKTKAHKQSKLLALTFDRLCFWFTM